MILEAVYVMLLSLEVVNMVKTHAEQSQQDELDYATFHIFALLT